MKSNSASLRVLVTGGTGFLGSALVRRLVREGHRVRVLDNNWRGATSRLADLMDDIEFVERDIRDPAAVERAVSGVRCVWHLASVNGTEHFYNHPDTVLDVGVRGMINLIDAVAKRGVESLFVASSSEVYQTPRTIPTDESAELSVPDVLNPRYSYAGAKLASELMALHWAALHVRRTVIFRPHNVYGPDMGAEHVVPQFALRMAALNASHARGATIDFPVEGTGRETRAFIYIDDFIDGLMTLLDRGENRTIYHVGAADEVAIADLARAVAGAFGRQIRIIPGEAKAGGTHRRCPDISRLRGLGFAPRVSLQDGLERTVRWYRDNVDRSLASRRVA